MARSLATPFTIPLADARSIWLGAQRLDVEAPFGVGPDAVRAAVEHLGYVQIDTINVIERCHHHILFTRIPDYGRDHLHAAQSRERSVFEYWTHALSYVPTRDMPVFVRAMRHEWQRRAAWYPGVSEADVRKLIRRIAKDGPLTLRDIDDDEPVEKTHLWASRKPSKRVLQVAFYRGLLTVSQREGMLKTYELASRHFGWDRRPRAATEAEVTRYRLDRALSSQGIVSLDSICHLEARRKTAVRREIEARVRRKQLVAVALDGDSRQEHWTAPEVLDAVPGPAEPRVHILSPFDPLIIQRRRLQRFFGYEHRFEAYVPREKRVLGYFALPVLIGDEVVAALDLKTDRERGKLLIQQWTWVGRGSPRVHKPAIEAELERFERFQIGRTQGA
jgi:hypothetical protein